MIMDQTQNLAILDDGILYYSQVGNQNGGKAVNTLATIKFLAGSMSELKVMADYTRSGTMDEAAIREGFTALEVLPLTKVAVIGASPYLTKLITEMAEAAG